MESSLDMSMKEAIRNYLVSRAPSDWTPPLLKSLPLRNWTGMLYDGLAYGNWPWTDFTMKEKP